MWRMKMHSVPLGSYFEEIQNFLSFDMLTSREISCKFSLVKSYASRLPLFIMYFTKKGYYGKKLQRCICVDASIASPLLKGKRKAMKF